MDVDLTEENSKDEEMNDKAKKAPEEAIKLKVADSSNIKVDMTDVPLVSYAPKISKSSGKRCFFAPWFLHSVLNWSAYV